MMTLSSISAQEVSPVLEFPETGLDDFSTYSGYTTRFYQDSDGNTVQVSLDANKGRIVHILANDANESIAFNARNSSGEPAAFSWLSSGATLSAEGNSRFLSYSISTDASELEIGLFLLSTMRLERDFQYFRKHLEPFDTPHYTMDQFPELIRLLEKLPVPLQAQHLAFLNAADTEELRRRLTPQVSQKSEGEHLSVLVRHPTFDGKNLLTLSLSVSREDATMDWTRDRVRLKALSGKRINLTITIGSDSPSLHPLSREEFFNENFNRFYQQAKMRYEQLLSENGRDEEQLYRDENWQLFRRMDRQVRSIMLLCSEEKFMAGMPNFATYFGRDMIMSALMLEPVLNPAILEHIINSALNKLTPAGEVSHEEALGSQAIRENADHYNHLMKRYFEKRSAGEQDAGAILAQAGEVLENLQQVTENYYMLDDDYQFTVLVARYLKNEAIPAARRKSFLQDALSQETTDNRLMLLLRNFGYVLRTAEPYAEENTTANLISFHQFEDGSWHSGSWRDSGAGYADGQYAMDINAIWVPQALEALQDILQILRDWGMLDPLLESWEPSEDQKLLAACLKQPQQVQDMLKTWQGSVSHFQVTLSSEKAKEQVEAKLNWLPEAEGAYWRQALDDLLRDFPDLQFLALSLDENGEQLQVVNTDPATWLFLENLTEQLIAGRLTEASIFAPLETFLLPYPAGLFMDGIGLAVANDSYESPAIWDRFESDIYHSPRVIWGREINLTTLGLARQILAAYDDSGNLKSPKLREYVAKLRHMLEKVRTAAIASGLKHNELWQYHIDDGRLLPARYPTTSDIQLWNLTDLAVQYVLHQVSQLK